MMIACFHAESNVVISTMLKLTCCTCLWECRKIRVSGRTPKSRVKVCIQGQQHCQAIFMPQETCDLFLHCSRKLTSSCAAIPSS